MDCLTTLNNSHSTPTKANAFRLTIAEKISAPKINCGRRGLPKEVVDAMMADYQRLGSTEKVAKIYGRKRQTVWQILRRREFLMKPPPRSRSIIIHNGKKYSLTARGEYKLTARKQGGELMLHRVLWSEKNGPIPPGYEVTFADGNKNNLSPENLVLLPRAEASRRACAKKYGRQNPTYFTSEKVRAMWASLTPKQKAAVISKRIRTKKRNDRIWRAQLVQKQKKKNPTKSAKNPQIDLMLEIFDTIREPGVVYPQSVIAEVIGCSRSLICLIERSAIKKLARAAQRLEAA